MKGRGRFSLDQEQIEERLAFMGFSEEDAERVRSLQDVLATVLPPVAAGLYAQIDTVPTITALLDGHRTQCRLKQSAYLKEMLKAVVDPIYATTRAWVGEIHWQIGVEPHWYIAAFSVLMQLLKEQLSKHESLKEHPEVLWEVSRSLEKLMFFDMSLAVEAYVRSLQEVNRSRELVMRELSAPAVLEIATGIVVLPLVGRLDHRRSRDYTGALLQAVTGNDAKAILVDLGRLPTLDADTGRYLLELGTMATTMGLVFILSQVTTALRRNLLEYGLDPDTVSIEPTLPDAIRRAKRELRRAGRAGAPPEHSDPPESDRIHS